LNFPNIAEDARLREKNIEVRCSINRARERAMTERWASDAQPSRERPSERSPVIDEARRSLGEPGERRGGHAAKPPAALQIESAIFKV